MSGASNEPREPQPELPVPVSFGEALVGEDSGSLPPDEDMPGAVDPFGDSAEPTGP